MTPDTHRVSLKDHRLTHLAHAFAGALEVEDACQGDSTCSCPYRRIPRRTAGAPLVAMFAVVGGLTNQ
eukprot:19255-Eustigmatos_ZCMA.PRE.1